MRLIPGNAQHIGKRSSQQDAFGFTELSDDAFGSRSGFVAVLADGMGGMEQGEKASRLAVRVFLDAYKEKAEDESISRAMTRSLDSANSSVHALACEAGAPEDVGTTLIAAAFQKEGLHWVSVGDSGLFLLRDGELVQLNLAHTYATRLDERAMRGEISAREAIEDPQRESLTSYVGASKLSEVDRNLRPFPLQAGDRILLASDGLFKTLREQEILDLTQERGDEAPDGLVREALRRGGDSQDNITVLTVSLRTSKETGKPAPIPFPAAAVEEDRESERDTRESRPRRRLWVYLGLGLLLGVALAGAVLWQAGWISPASVGPAPVAESPLGERPRDSDANPTEVPPVHKGDEETVLPPRPSPPSPGSVSQKTPSDADANEKPPDR